MRAQRAAAALAFYMLAAMPPLLTSQPTDAPKRITFPALGRIVQLPTAKGDKPCFVSFSAVLPGTWNEPQYEVQEVSPGSFYAIPAGTRVKLGKEDRSEAAQKRVERVANAFESALPFSDDLNTKALDACRYMDSWIDVFVTFQDPDVNGGMYRTDTNALFIDLADLDAERYIPADGSAADGNLASRLAKSQNIRTTLAHEIDHMRGPGHDDPVPEEQHIFVGLPGLDENRVMDDLGYPLRRVAYGSPDGVPYESLDTRVFLRSGPAVVTATGEHEAHRAEPSTTRAFEEAANRWSTLVNTSITVKIDVDFGPTRFGDGDRDYDGLLDSFDPCPEIFSPTQQFDCGIAPDARTAAPFGVVAEGLTAAPKGAFTTWTVFPHPQLAIPGAPGAGTAGHRADIANPGLFLTYALKYGAYDTGIAIANTTVDPYYGLATGAVRSVNSLTTPAVASAAPLPNTQTQATARILPFVVPALAGAELGGVPRPSTKLFFVSLGQSTGDAVRMIAINDGNVPVTIASDGVIVEPVAGLSAEGLLQPFAGLPRVEMTLKAYCRNRNEPFPPAGTVLRLAPDAVQQSVGPTQRIFAAAQRLVDTGTLVADVDGNLYLDSIRQWALWNAQEGFNQQTFTSAFVDHTKKNVAAAGQKWQPRFDRDVRDLAASRWRSVRAVAQEAERLSH